MIGGTRKRMSYFVDENRRGRKRLRREYSMAHKVSKKRELIGKKTRKLGYQEGGALVGAAGIAFTSYSFYKIYSCVRSLYNNYMFERKLIREIAKEQGKKDTNFYWKTNSLCCKYFNSYMPYYYDLTDYGDDKDFYKNLYKGINQDFYPTRYFETSDNKITPLKFPDTLYFEVKCNEKS